MSKEKPEVGDVYECETGVLLRIMDTTDWGFTYALLAGEHFNITTYYNPWRYLENKTYLGKSKVSIKELFDVE